MAMPEYPASPTGSGFSNYPLPDVIIDSQIRIAQPLAAELHQTQKYDETCGVSYYDGHLTPVVEIGEKLCRMTDRHRLAVPALWLHDAVEDTDATLEYLGERGIISPVLSVVDLMTRDKGESYRSYMQALSRDPDATLGKLADSLGNLRTNLEFHPHETPRVVRRRLLKYPKNVAQLSSIVFGETIDVEDDVRHLADDPTAARDALVDVLSKLSDTVQFDPNTPDEEVRRQLLTYPKQAAFLAQIVLGESLRMGVVDEIGQAVRHQMV